MSIYPIPEAGSEWIHIRSQQRYRIEVVANIDCEKEEFVPTVVYRNSNTQQVFARPLSEWRARFNPLPKKS